MAIAMSRYSYIEQRLFILGCKNKDNIDAIETTGNTEE